MRRAVKMVEQVIILIEKLFLKLFLDSLRNMGQQYFIIRTIKILKNKL